MILVIVPFWTSILIRTYAWIFILGGRGIPQLLDLVGIHDVRLINTPFSVPGGDRLRLPPAHGVSDLCEPGETRQTPSRSLQRPRFDPLGTFLQVTLPLSLPGVATGCMLVFILLMGEFLIPALLGGGKVFFVGNALVDLFLQSRNWAYGSAVAATLVIVMLVVVSLYMRLMMRAAAQRSDVSLL